MTDPIDRTPEALERRIVELELKASEADDLLDRLNTQVWRQQEAIDLLVREFARLREQQRTAAADAPFQSLRDELPPHY